MRSVLILWLGLVSGLVPGRAVGQPLGLGGPDMSSKVLFVPPLHGAVTFSFGFEGRLDGVITSPTAARIPETTLRVGGGYLHYFDGHGRLGAGGYLAVALGVDKADAAWPDTVRFDVGGVLRWRGISPQYFHWTLGLYGEVGLLTAYQGRLDPTVAVDAPLGTGVRWAAGIETGPGLLFHLSPYVFGEFTVRFGVENTRVDTANITALTLSTQFSFDFALRGREIE